MVGDVVRELGRRCLLDQQRAGPDPQREDHQPAEAEGERQRWRAGEDIVAARLHDLRRERVGDRQHVSVEVHRRLGAARRTGREGEEGHVVGSRRDVGVRFGLVHDHRGQVIGSGAAVGDGRDPGDARGQVVEEAVVTQREVDPCDLVDVGQLPRAKHGHGGHDHSTRLEDSEPAGDQPGSVRSAQQHPVARLHAQLRGQQVRDPVGRAQQLPIAPGVASRSQQTGPVRSQCLDRLVQERGRAVEPIGVGELGSIQQEVRPLGLGREVRRDRRCRRARMSCRPSPSFLTEAQLYDVLLTAVNVSICPLSVPKPWLSGQPTFPLIHGDLALWRWHAVPAICFRQVRNLSP